MAQPQPDGASKPRSVEGIFSDFQQRRNGLLLALTTDSDRFFAACNPQARFWVPACAPLPRDLVLSAYKTQHIPCVSRQTTLPSTARLMAPGQWTCQLRRCPQSCLSHAWVRAGQEQSLQILNLQCSCLCGAQHVCSPHTDAAFASWSNRPDGSACAGINFARDGMQRRDWLALVAVHSDAWLIAVAFYFAAKLDAVQR